MDIKLVDGLNISECKSKWDADDGGFNNVRRYQYSLCKRIDGIPWQLQRRLNL